MVGGRSFIAYGVLREENEPPNERAETGYPTVYKLIQWEVLLGNNYAKMICVSIT